MSPANQTSSRTGIFRKIEAATAAATAQSAIPELPVYDPALVIATRRLAPVDGAGGLTPVFQRNLAAVSGRLFVQLEALLEFLKDSRQTTGYCDPALDAEVGAFLRRGGLEVATEYDISGYDRYQFGITRATGAIAESGTLILDDETTSARLAALSPWVHIAVLRENEIHADIPAAIARLGSSRNVTWCTGPSKTADVEGILIEGVHGPGEQIALLLAAPATGI